jgi:hypothetical protein
MFSSIENSMEKNNQNEGEGDGYLKKIIKLWYFNLYLYNNNKKSTKNFNWNWIILINNFFF